MPILFKFGQVDVEFIYAFKRIKDDREAFEETHYAAFIDDTAQRYAAALHRLVPQDMRARTVVASIFPPALTDEAWGRGYVNATIAHQHSDQGLTDLARSVSRLEVPSLAVRTRMHDRFNSRIQSMSEALGMGYLDGFTPFLTPDGVLDARFRGRRDGSDHHLAFGAARKPVIERIWAMFDGLDHV